MLSRLIAFALSQRLLMLVLTALLIAAGLVRVPFPRFLLVDLAAVLVSVPLSFGVAYAVADSVAMALARVREMQFWVAGLALLILAAWLVVLLRRHRRG